MKKNAVLALSLVMALTILSTAIPISAKIPSGSCATNYSYSGKVLEYTYPPVPLSSKVIGGSWYANIRNYNPNTGLAQVTFKLVYSELNLMYCPEEYYAPVGSVDLFMITYKSEEPCHVTISPDGTQVWLQGTFVMDKLAWQPQGTMTPVIYKYHYFDNGGNVYLNIPEHRFYLSVAPWYLSGTIN
jgi:hypothetical protein